MDLFLNPALLAGAGLAVAPIVLHLIMRQRPQHLQFPALRFIQKRHDVNRRQLRLRHLLLLLLRAAAVALLALALARPTIKASGFFADREGPVAAAMIFDTLPHMDYKHDNQTRIEVAQHTALQMLARLPEESQIGVLDWQVGAPVFQVDRGAARQRIQRLATSGVGQSLPQSIESALELLKTSEHPKEIYIFSDLAASSWKTQAGHDLADRIEQLHASVYLFDVGVEQPQDFGLGELRLSGQVLPKNTPLRIATDVSSVGMTGEKVVESYLVNPQGKPEKRGQESVVLGADGSTPVEIVLGALDEGNHQGYLRILGEDGLAADNVRYFTAQVRSAWRVLVIAPKPAPDLAFYFTEALAPIAFRRNRQARFDCQVIDYDRLGSQKLESFAAVFLLDPPPLPETAWQQLGTYAEAGGGVGIFLGERAQPVKQFNSAAAGELVPGPLGQQARHPDGDIYLAGAESHHPVFKKFEPLRDSVPWEAFPVYRYWQFAKLATGTQIVAAYSDGRPALVERSLGKGRIITMTTPISEPLNGSAGDRWNLLPTGFEPWPFVMLANELALYLAGSADSQLNYLAGQTAIVRLPDKPRFATYQVVTPKDELKQPPEALQNSVIVTATEMPGNYQVKAGGQQGVDLGFSINLPVEATQLSRIGEPELDAVFGSLHVRPARSDEQIEREVQTGRTGHELFPLLILGLVAILALEHLLANRFYRETRKADARVPA
ncbi:MAG TPA: VWA domain-containing protein [Pirellulales bacterium]|jgi:hypothetical protein|nr:VWA domain-containing protein [Pirellulales bacterium]